MPEELVGELTTKMTSTTIQKIGREGVRGSQNSQGRMKGLYNASHLDTVDLLYKPDGPSEFELRAMEMITEGDVILLQGRGTGNILNPTTNRLEGTCSFQTASKKFAWLNAAKGRLEGSANPTTGEATVKVFAQK
ncbi:MAG TPA: hypothetical protein VEY12_04630 [Thermoplasmata archaeon]|nr:hypothetical protein [Thermoplasmata archaeon]